jgi:hypothetical protein
MAVGEGLLRRKAPRNDLAQALVGAKKRLTNRRMYGRICMYIWPLQSEFANPWAGPGVIGLDRRVGSSGR